MLAIGNTIIDTMLTMPRIPLDDKIFVDSKLRYVGGQGANAAQCMALLGLDVSFVTRIGDDGDGRWARDLYESLGMDTSRCLVAPGALTMSACVAVERETSRRTCLMHRDEKLFEDPAAQVAPIDWKCFDAVNTDGHDPALTLPIVRAAAAAGLRVFSDMEVCDDDRRELADLATDLVAPARIIRELAGLDTREAVLALANVRPGRTVVATEGSQGSVGARYGDREVCSVPALSCDVRDTTGAGDAYHAGFVAAFARGIVDLRQTMELATRAAAASCETPGPVASLEALRKLGAAE